MPLVQLKLIEGVFSTEQKQRMIEGITDVMVSVEGENLRGLTMVVIDEVKSGEWAIGGKALSAAEVKALAAGKSGPAPDLAGSVDPGPEGPTEDSAA